MDRWTVAPMTPPVVDDGAEISAPGAHACPRACCAKLLVIIGMKGSAMPDSSKGDACEGLLKFLATV